MSPMSPALPRPLPLRLVLLVVDPTVTLLLFHDTATNTSSEILSRKEQISSCIVLPTKSNHLQ